MNYIKQYINILRIVNESEDSKTSEIIPHTALNVQLVKELIEEGYLIGSPMLIDLNYAKQDDFKKMTSTVKGRIFQNDLEQKLKDQTFLGKINKHVAIIIGFVLGIGCNLIVETVKHKYLK